MGNNNTPEDCRADKLQGHCALTGLRIKPGTPCNIQGKPCESFVPKNLETTSSRIEVSPPRKSLTAPAQ